MLLFVSKKRHQFQKQICKTIYENHPNPCIQETTVIIKINQRGKSNTKIYGLALRTDYHSTVAHVGFNYYKCIGNLIHNRVLILT